MFFLHCINLSDVEIPQSITTLGINSLRGCAFTTIELPENLQTIEQGAFQDCFNLTTINIPENVSPIGTSAFNNCPNLTGISLPPTLPRIEEYLFQKETHRF
jgi:hypothetical protein